MNSPTFSMSNTVTQWPWRPLYWEPVSGTGERIMIGVLHGYANEYRAIRTIRNDVLDCLFGKSALGLKRIIDHSLNVFQVAAQATNSLDALSSPISGIYPGPLRATEASSAADLLYTACLLYSSLGNLDKLDEAEVEDSPQQEEVNRRFGSEVKQEVAKIRPDLMAGFGRGGELISGGMFVKFGYFSPVAVLHFTVLHPVRQSASMRDARARIFELQRAKVIAGINSAALIAAVPREDDATLGSKQREQLRANSIEIEREADAVSLRWFAVHTAMQGAERLIEIASA
jgi:hypothetical protein